MMTGPLRLLLVEDDGALRATLVSALRLEGYEVHTAASFSEALQLLAHLGRGLGAAEPASDHFLDSAERQAQALALLGRRQQQAGSAVDAVLLDLGLPDGEGLTLLKALRRQSRTPVLVISARGAEADKVGLLDAGADDYLVKPFGIAELLARLRVALRHQRGQADLRPAITRYRKGRLEIDLAVPLVRRDGEDIHLTPTELRLLAALVRQAGRVCTHRALLSQVWGADFVAHTHYLRLYMAQLRAKLEAEPADPQLLLTEAGVGYRLVEGD
ncbi:MAG: hypothetical protein RL722_2550 [Pseudomonadota bacterium]|jgi:two-component system KDP operon response regulator KdpE